MIRPLVLLAGAAAVVTLARPAFAQGPFSDVPADHWAKDAVNELAARGLVTGYPDGTFGGKRVLNRYEFAVVNQRILQQLQHIRPLAAPTAAPSASQDRVTREQLEERLRNLATREQVDRLRSDVDQLSRLMDQLRETMAVLRVEVDQLKREVGDIGGRRPHTNSRSQPKRNGSP
jgi:hypothetical protein